MPANPIHSSADIRSMAVDSRIDLSRSLRANKKKRKVVNKAFPTPPINRAIESFSSGLDSNSETSSHYSTLSEELLLIAEKYKEAFNDQDRSQLNSSLWRGATNFLVKFKIDDKIDLHRELLYEGSSLTIMDLCILLNALRSR